jgi:23S rRNA (guanosine2251-2'-O)-methyltransferase
MVVYGINPVREALKAHRVERLLVASRSDPRVQALIELAAGQGVPVAGMSRTDLDHRSGGGLHQGVIADVRPGHDWSVEELVRSAPGTPLLVVLDGIEDPQNLGAILRSCDAAGVDGVIRQTRRAAPLGGTVARASAGASAHVRVADVVNISRALDALKGLGVWTVGLAGEGSRTYDAVDFSLPTAVVVGNEGEGLRRLVRESCDWLVAIPMLGHVSSLNVSVAAGVVLFEACRQRGFRRREGVGGGGP